MVSDDPGSAPIDGTPRSCTVTFGRSSFVGRSLVAFLLNSGDWTVRIADPQPPPEPGADRIISDSIRLGRASYRQVDFRDQSQVHSAVEGSSVVFHMDPTAVPSPRGVRDFYHLYMIAVQGTKNVIAACRECGVERLVYTGSADVVFDGVHSVHGGDESLPYPERFLDELNDLRAQAEALVLFANGINGLSTCALRPSNPFGPGDGHLVAFLVGQAKSGRAKVIIGNGKNMCDFTYVENVAHANICAERALRSKIASVAGKPFFITNNEPVELWGFISNILGGLGYKRPRIHLPFKLALLVVVLFERVRDKLGFCRTSNSHLTPATIHVLSCTRTFDCSEAQRRIGYSPIVSLEDGVTLTVESFSQSENESAYFGQRDFSKPSKADKLLGSGSVADILLWRDDKKTFTCLLALVMLSYWYLYSGSTFVSSTAKLLLLVSVILFVHGVLPSSIFGFTVQKFSSSYFEVSELDIRHSFIALASLWNRGICRLKSLAEGDDWNIFFKTACFLCLLKLLSSIQLPVLVGVGLVCLFTVFIVYDQCEEEVEKLMTTTIVGVQKLQENLIAKLLGLVTYVRKS